MTAKEKIENELTTATQALDAAIARAREANATADRLRVEVSQLEAKLASYAANPEGPFELH